MECTTLVLNLAYTSWKEHPHKVTFENNHMKEDLVYVRVLNWEEAGLDELLKEGGSITRRV